MKHTRKDSPTNQITNPKRMLTFLRRPVICFGSIITIAAGIALLANAQQPVLRIANLGENQFLLEITNNATPTNYTLFWTPALADQNYPWVVLGVGETGTTNFLIDGGTWPSGFFKVLLGGDADGDSVPAWKDANDTDSNIGILSVTIDSPISGASFD